MTDLARDLVRRIDERVATVAVVGQGYVGLPVAMRASELGFPVIGLDSSAERIATLQRGSSYVEDVTDAEVAQALKRGYVPTSEPADLAGFDIAVITVPTPLREGLPDLSFIETAGRAIARVLRPGALVVLESTTYPGTTDELLLPLLEADSSLRPGDDFFLAYSPERIDPGNRTWNLVNTPKVVGAIDHRSQQVAEAFYGSLVDKVVPVQSTAEAELVKLLENTFRHVNIALVNELAMFARSLGVDIWSAVDAASTKPFGYMRFIPGPGVGGHCLPVDPSYLSWRIRRRLGHSFRFVELANDINDHMPHYVATRIVHLLNREGRTVNGSDILLLGVAYKASTSDWRESPSLPVAEQLRSLGARVRACDPHVPDVNAGELDVPLVPLSSGQLKTADLVVVLVDHPEFTPELIVEHARLVFDAKGLLRGRTFPGEIL